MTNNTDKIKLVDLDHSTYKVNSYLEGGKRLVANNPNRFVYMDNELTASLGKLSHIEQKLFDYCVSLIKETDQIDDVYRIKVADILKAFKINKSGKNMNLVLNSFIEMLNEYVFIWDGEEKIFRLYHFFKDGVTVYLPEECLVQFAFTDYMYPYLYSLKKNYTAYPIAINNLFSSKYAIIFYRFWASNDRANLKKVILSGGIDSWGRIFGIADKRGKLSRTVADFKQRVLSPALKEMKKYFKLYDFNLEAVKSGRKIVGYKLIITKDDQILSSKFPVPDMLAYGTHKFLKKGYRNKK